MHICIKKFIHFKEIVCLWIFVVVISMAFPLQAMQDNYSNYLHVTGWVVKDDKPLANAEITITEEGVVLSSMKTNFAGSFSFFVPFQKEYHVTFSKEGLITKNVIIDTKTPEEPDSLFYYYFQFEVELFKDSPYARREFFKDPVAIVFYDAGVHDFEYYRSNVKVFSAKAQNLFKDSLGVAFEYPESFFEYIQSLTEQPEQLHMIVDKEPLAEQAGNEKESGEMAEESHSADQVEDSWSSNDDTPGTRQSSQDLTKEMAIDNQLNQTEEQNQPEKPIVFYNYLTGELLEPGPEKFYTVQLLATARSVPEGYFTLVTDSLHLDKVLRYKDSDHLDKYTVGIYKNVREALAVSRKLEEMGYEIFIVAFAQHRRLW